jgi:2-polyprenyl-6-hydroxyphenyl methylase/3-demethylubiquinone-9 3-methyltransferase
MATPSTPHVNNEIYDALGDRWYEAQDDPVALLRAESAHREPWIIETIERRFRGARIRVLDIGCGAGFLTNPLAARGWNVTGLDASERSLAVARERDQTRSVRYESGDACDLPHPDESFDVVCAMDFLEHVTDPGRVIAEAARVLRPRGLFFFHTFNRTFLAWLIVIKGVEWFVKNTPPDLHVLSLFLDPEEVRSLCQANDLEVRELRGSRPVIFSRAFFRLLATGIVPKDFAFRFTGSTQIAYTGLATKRPPGQTLTATGRSREATRLGYTPGGRGTR